MLRKLLLMLALLITSGATLFAQQGTLKGTITNADDGEPIPFVNVGVFKDGQQVKGAASGMDGIFTIKPLSPGKYDVKASAVGFGPIEISNFEVRATDFSVCDIKMQPTSTTLQTVVIPYEKAIIEIGETGTGGTKSADDIARLPVTSVDGITSTMPGVSFTGNSVRGETGMVSMVNGVRRHGGANNIPLDAIQEVQVILGGTSASIGEAIGGAQIITLKPPASTTIGRINYETRVDYSGYHRLNVFLSGPLYKKKEANGVENTIIGYRLSGYGITGGDLTYRKKNSYWMLKDDVRDAIAENPLLFRPDGRIEYAADFLRKSDFERVNSRPGIRSWTGNLEGALNIRFSSDMTLQISADYNYQNGLSTGSYPLNNFSKSRQISQGFTVSAEFTHRFPDREVKEGESAPSIKNLMYVISGSYASEWGSVFNDKHKDDFFQYGHVGTFISHLSLPGQEDEGNSYELVRKEYLGEEIYVYEQQRGLPKIDSISFIPNLNNPSSKYTTALYNQFGNGFTNIKDQIGSNELKGVINGMNPTSIIGKFQNIGVTYGSYGKSQNEYIYIQAKASGDIKNHSIEFGFQYDQTISRGYSLGASSLWTVMRDITNNQIMEHDLDNPIIVDSLQDIYFKYNRKYNEAAQSVFDKNLRKKLGKAVNGTGAEDWIQIDALDPNTFSLDMFSPDELYRGGGNNNLVSYYGYDHTGKVVRGKTNISDYYEDNRRMLGAWSPIYMAGFIQDKFFFSDLIFNVGVRVDYFDGNQMVLKDPYLLYPSYTAGEVSEGLNHVNKGKHPSNIGSDYVVYVNKLSSDPNNIEIVGYRNGSTWYNAEGVPVADPYEIKGDNPQPTPYRKDAENTNVTSEVFKKYEPQIVFMPRIAFSFPVSDQSQFKASYDIIARRPPAGGWQAPYYEYMFINQVGQTPINNPDLKPEKITNYELGFQQALNKFSAFSISAYYKETRDLISPIQLVGADPNPNLYTYGNKDYKTTKGVSITYDLRRSRNLRLSANYTLQFAETTTLPLATMRALMVAGYPNLKLLNPISNDQRHEIKVDLSYQFGRGSEYTGPKTTRVVKEDGQDKSKTTLWFENMGAAATVVAVSGAPYTKLESWTQKTIVGGFNGSRMPWQFYMRIQVDKSWVFNQKSAKAKLASGGRLSMLMAYIRVDNILDIRNVVALSSYTGDPEDDGYLTDPGNQATIRNQVNEASFRELYELYLANGAIGSYSAPRTITLGLAYSF